MIIGVDSVVSQGGVLRVTVEWMKAVMAADPDLKFLVRQNSTGEDFPLRDSRVRVDQLTSGRGVVAFLQGIQKIPTKQVWQPDLWQTSYYSAPPTKGTPELVVVYDFISRFHPLTAGNIKNFRELQESAIKRAAAIACISHTVRDELFEEFPETLKIPVHVVTLGVASEFQNQATTPPPPSLAGKRFFVYVGRRGMYKNFSLFLDAFLRVAGLRDVYLAVVGGEGVLKESQASALIRSGLEHRVMHFPKASDALLASLYRSAVACVMPSIAEGFGLPVIEAQACGCPVLMSDIPVLREISGGHGLFASCSSVDDFVEKLLDLVDSGVSPNLIEAARINAERYRWEKAGPELLQIYRTFAQSR